MSRRVWRPLKRAKSTVGAPLRRGDAVAAGVDCVDALHLNGEGGDAGQRGVGADDEGGPATTLWIRVGGGCGVRAAAAGDEEGGDG